MIFHYCNENVPNFHFRNLVTLKLTNLESTSRRNNIRIYGVTDWEEGESAAKFVQDLLKRELHLPEDFNLQIQRAHRSLAQRPADGDQPRPIIVNFLEFTSREFWEKYGERKYNWTTSCHSTVITRQRLFKREKNSTLPKGSWRRKFQTRFTRMRIHWETGTHTYNSAEEAKKELERGGLSEKTQTADSLESRLRTTMEWQWGISEELRICSGKGQGKAARVPKIHLEWLKASLVMCPSKSYLNHWEMCIKRNLNHVCFHQKYRLLWKLVFRRLAWQPACKA